MGNPPSRVWILGILFLAAFIIGGSFFYTRVVKKSPQSTKLTSPPPLKADTQAGVKAAQKMFADYPQFVKRAFIQQQIEGTLKAINGNNWTIETGGKSLTLANEGTNEIRFTKLPKIATGSSTKAVSPTEIKSEEIKIGDLLSISQVIDWQTGKIAIVGITVLPPR